MKEKVTISIDEKVKQKGKRQATQKGLSFSAYLTVLINKETKNENN